MYAIFIATKDLYSFGQERLTLSKRKNVAEQRSEVLPASPFIWLLQFVHRNWLVCVSMTQDLRKNTSWKDFCLEGWMCFFLQMS